MEFDVKLESWHPVILGLWIAAELVYCNLELWFGILIIVSVWMLTLDSCVWYAVIVNLTAALVAHNIYVACCQ